MVFNKATKQAFVHPPKTGTHTTQDFLRTLGWKTLPMTHARTERLIRDYPNLNDYTIYGFLRDPLLRFESVILHLKRMPTVDSIFEKVLRGNGVTDSLEVVSYETVIDVFPKLAEALPAFCHQQAAWLDHPKVTVLDFDNYETELRRISGNYTSPLSIKNKSTDFGKSVVTQRVIDFVRQEYAADYALAKDRLGKEY